MNKHIHLGQIKNEKELLELARRFNSGEIGDSEALGTWGGWAEMSCTTLSSNEYNHDFKLLLYSSGVQEHPTVEASGRWGDHVLQTGVDPFLLEITKDRPEIRKSKEEA